MAFADGHVENRGAANEKVFSPCLSADHEIFVAAIAPFHYDSAAVLGAIEACRAVGHAQPATRRVVKRKILAEDPRVHRVSIRDGMVRPVECDTYVCAR